MFKKWLKQEVEFEAIEQRSLDRGFLASRVPKGELGHNYMRMRLAKSKSL